MKRLFISLLSGLLLAAAFLGIAFAIDGAVLHLHWLRDLFIGPPLWLLKTGLPSLSAAFTIERGGPYSGASFFMLFFVVFWWVVCSAALFLFRRQPPKQ
jgi:hypothetical protein